MEEKEGVLFLVLYKEIYLSSFGVKNFQADPYIFLLDAVCRLGRFWGFEASHFSFTFSYQIRMQMIRLMISEEKNEMESGWFLIGSFFLYNSCMEIETSGNLE